MCGIAGVVYQDRSACPEQLEAMIAMLRHRGPDAAALYTDRQVGLAHARLSIIDLRNGQQPMRSADHHLAITFNGEIFNYVELRERLRQRGHHFRTESDTEVVLHAYAEFGERCVDHFNGQWAFAIWDRLQQRLFLSRDRLGIRPLYYTRMSRAFLFASEVKGLMAHEGVQRALDPIGLNQLLTYWAPLAPRTVFAGIEELPPGHNLFVDAQHKVDSYPYWTLDYSTESPRRSTDEWSGRLGDLLTDATRLRLRADVPVGAYLSGGLDSTAITTLARQFTGGRLRTFSVVFEDDEFDESHHQRRVVEALGVEHRTMHCSCDDIARIFPQVIWHAEKPLLRTAPAPLQMLAELVHASGVKVVLTGEGADEILGGYDIFKEAKVRRFCAAQPNSERRMALLSSLYPYLPRLQAQSLAMRQAFFQARPEDLGHPCFSHLPRWSLTASLRRFLNADYRLPATTLDDHAQLAAWLPRRFEQWPPFCRAQFLEATLLMPGYILSSQGDRMAMAHSVEGRFPFLDHRLVEFAAQIPPRLKMKGTNEKYLLKRALQGTVPEAVRQRTKQPYRAPDATSFFQRDGQSTRADYVCELFSDACLRDFGVFHPQAVGKLLGKVRGGRAEGMRDNMAIVAILSTQLLIDQFIRNNPRRRRQHVRGMPENSLLFNHSHQTVIPEFVDR